MDILLNKKYSIHFKKAYLNTTKINKKIKEVGISFFQREEKLKETKALMTNIIHIKIS